MKALTFWPEWLWAIRHLGKDEENRGWAPSAAQLQAGDVFALHAGKELGGRRGRPATLEALLAVRQAAEVAGWSTFTTSYLTGEKHDDPGVAFVRSGVRRELRASQVVTSRIVGLAVYGGARRRSNSWWANPDACAWSLRNCIWLSSPIPHGGTQGLWTVPRPVMMAIHRQLLELNLKLADDIEQLVRGWR